jgi:N-acyl homoserine lactone hydrolase
MGKVQRVGAYAVLLETSEGYVLIYTGLNPKGIENPEETWGALAKVILPHVQEKVDIRRGLAQLNVTPEQIRIVINTHMHFDHTGGNHLFQHAKFVVQKAEYRFAMNPDRHWSGSYMKNHFDCDLNYQLVEGDCELLPGIDLLFTPGHSPGHQSIFITIESGRKFIVAGDAINTLENMKRLLPSGLCWDEQQAILSLQKLMTISRLTGAAVIPSHEPDTTFYDNMQEMLCLE